MQTDIQRLLDIKVADWSNSELSDLYSTGLHRVLDQHALPSRRKVTSRLSAPWTIDSSQHPGQ